jgi:hypothetical protein
LRRSEMARTSNRLSECSRAFTLYLPRAISKILFCGFVQTQGARVILCFIASKASHRLA